MAKQTETSNPLEVLQPASRTWFENTFKAPTAAQAEAWPAIARGEHTLLLAPTGSGKTLAAFLVAIDRMMFGPPPLEAGTRVLYVSPLKALGVDVERNLKVPLAGVQTAAGRLGVPYHRPRIGVRTGDTPTRERHLLISTPPDILITTPESLYLMLTSRAREALRRVQAVIVDEIHSLVATKRGAHLLVSLERLVALSKEYGGNGNIQRVGLSATQRPLAEVARALGGADVGTDPRSEPQPRPVTVIDVGRRKQFDLKVEVPVEDMPQPAASVPDAATPGLPSIWPSIHPRLVALIRAHRSTMIFVNSRRLAERLATAVNELAAEELALAHHGSVAKDTRARIEDRLKRGLLPAIVATSSLELGIDMGAVDLVIQIEAPPSVASGIQRVGRAGHQVGAVSKAVIFPKYRGDLLAAAAATEAMVAGRVEASAYPRNPLDVLAQQVVAMVALEPRTVDHLYAVVRGAAPFSELPRAAFENVLDLLAGRYPADEFAELRPRVNWDRMEAVVSPRRGAQRTAILNAGTIPDRGLYGVFLADDDSGGGRRVGELDEEMVFETRPGDVFLLGASSWRVLDITHDRVLVAPAPGEPGRMPFWRGDGPGRPLEFGRAIGALTRKLISTIRDNPVKTLIDNHFLTERAAINLIRYLSDQVAAAGAAPDDQTIVVESFVDEVGDWRVTILSPFGVRVHAPWAIAVAGALRARGRGEVDVLWSDDGIVLRLPELDGPPPVADLVPRADAIEGQVMRALGSTALFAARFRENAARALLLPKKYPGRRTPLWVQRRRSADLLSVAAGYDNFPIILETYRECLKDVFDLPGLIALLREVEQRAIAVHVVNGTRPSPFASSLLFNYVANFIYDGDAPLAERRAQTLALDHVQLRELLGDAELRELLDPQAVQELALELQLLDARWLPRDADDVHDLLRRLGDLSQNEIHRRCPGLATEIDAWIALLRQQRRVIAVSVADESRLVTAEDAGRLRDALGTPPPPGLPAAFLEPAADPVADLVSRYARTHVPFTVQDISQRLGLEPGSVRDALTRLAARDRVFEGEFLPAGSGREWCDQAVLRMLKRRSLARLRKQVEPVEPRTLARFLPAWQGLTRPRRGLDGLLDVIEQLQGAAIPFSVLERQVLAARIADFRSADLDQLFAAGEVLWQGREPIGEHDGRVALYLTGNLSRLAAITAPVGGELCHRVRSLLAERGATFFDELTAELDAFPNDVLRALWELVWGGEATNDSVAPLRARQRPRAQRGRRRPRPLFRSRRSTAPPGSEGRWSLISNPHRGFDDPTTRHAALAGQLLERYGVVTRELVASENVAGGFAGLYPVFKAMEEAGKVRRGYFVAGRGASQFALPGADDRLRELPRSKDSIGPLVLAATDPANAYGAALRWPETPREQARPQRAAGARVVLRNGELIGYLGKTSRSLMTFAPAHDADEAAARADLIRALIDITRAGEPLLIVQVNGRPTAESELSEGLLAAGFSPSSRGFLRRATDT